MTHKTLYIISLVMAFMTAGCTDDDLYPGQQGDGAPVSPLRLEVTPFTVSTGGTTRSAEPSPNPEQESEQERRIRDFWLFQFSPDGTRQLAAPAYYSIPDNGATLNDLTLAAYNNLVKNTPMTIFIVANTGSSTWASGTGFSTLAGMKEQTLPSPFPIQAGIDEDGDGVADDIYIPMTGQLDNVTVSDNNLVVVPVTRIYAKVKIQVEFNEPTMNFYYADVRGIPWYCKVSTLATATDAATGEPAAASYPANTRIISRAFNSKETVTDADGTKWLILYMPENIRGEVGNADKATSQNIPENALTVAIRSKYNGADYYYTVYPGENTRNNFNVRRNCVYRVSIDVRNITDQHNPSSNCYIVKPGEKLSFEPYNRIEKGGGYNISTYLDPNVTTKKIAYARIIWQTKNCIGDNTDGNLVHFDINNENPRNSKIIIERTGVEGNALVGAFNSKNEILWSWHIWVTPNEPDNIANAVIYTTYRWDTKGIYPNERVPGYGIMPCNLGALDFRSDNDMPKYSIPSGTIFPYSQIRTFGMLYQWGRKDPFPPMIFSTGTEDANGNLEYTNEYTGEHYANDNQTIVNKTSDYNANPNTYLFYSVLGGNQNNPVQYAIAHPTVYMSGTTSTSGNAYNRKNGDWCGVNAGNTDGLWGGTKGSGGYAIKEDYTTKAHLYDNYGEKSIFDPCPQGWRVPPGDLWLGFTSTGLNPTVEKSGSWLRPILKSNYEKEVNYSQEESGYRPGMSMYVQNWRKGPTVYFPLQGTRIYNGKVSNTGLCGNYHNATCDDGGRVNILHLHRNMDIVSNWDGTGGTNGNILFMIFEYEHPQYYSKSTAGPIRCVRDSR